MSRMLLAARVAVWLASLPVRLRAAGLSAVLADSSPTDYAIPTTNVPAGYLIDTVVRVCRLRVFGHRLFPRTCLREALAVYHVLRGMGYPAHFHIGVYKNGGRFGAHSWVTLRGTPVAPLGDGSGCRTIYSYPP